jgi:hypothetical protein
MGGGGSRFPSFFEETGVIKESWTGRFFCEKNQKPPVRWKSVHDMQQIIEYRLKE